MSVGNGGMVEARIGNGDRASRADFRSSSCHLHGTQAFDAGLRVVTNP